MTRNLALASWLAVGRPALLAPAGLALLLLALTFPALDDGHGVTVLRGVAILLACAVAAATDDPAGEVAAASPATRWQRSAARLATAVAVVLPVWVVAVVTVRLGAGEPVVWSLGLYLLALCAAGTAVGAGLRAWRGHLAPSQLAVPAVVVAAVLGESLPRWYAVAPLQTWGPPWEATQIRWIAVVLLGAGLVVMAWRDPLERGRPRRRPVTLEHALP